MAIRMVFGPHPRRAATLAITAWLTVSLAAAGGHDFLPILGCREIPDLPGEDVPENLSGAAQTSDGGLLLLAPDEGSTLFVLTPAGVVPVPLGKENDEIDLEGVTRHGDGPTFFAVGSHSWRRKSIDGDRRDGPYSELRERFEDESPDEEKDRDRLIRFRIDPDSGGLDGDFEDFDLRTVLNEHPVLRPFRKIPSKENGIDIEGIASDGTRLYLGFRGPVFRFGLTPVLVAAPDQLNGAELGYVSLDGRGVRDIARVQDGFLIVAGPVGDISLSYQLYFWDGETTLWGEREEGDPPLGESKLLGTIPTPPDGKAEALVVLDERDGSWDLLVLYDGPTGGSPACFRVPRP